MTEPIDRAALDEWSPAPVPEGLRRLTREQVALRQDAVLFRRFAQTIEQRSPESAVSHIARWALAAAEDIDALLVSPDLTGALDVELLSRALAVDDNPNDPDVWDLWGEAGREWVRKRVRRILARYAALAASKPVPATGNPEDHGWESYKDAFPAGKNIIESATGNPDSLAGIDPDENGNGVTSRLFAEGIDVERLARALAAVSPTGTKYPERLAAEYARQPKGERP